MPLNEADTRAKLIDPALHSNGWTEDSIRREVTAGAIEIVGGVPRQRATARSRVRVGYNRGGGGIKEGFGGTGGLIKRKITNLKSPGGPWGLKKPNTMASAINFEQQ